MDYLVTALAAFAAAVLTLFSGFGLGTVLAPVFALFFPLPVAVAATAVVHLANNLVKLALLGRAADWRVVRRFGVPAALAAVPGALALAAVAGLEPVYRYALGGREFAVAPAGLTLGLLIVLFALLELSPAFATVAIPRRWLPLGGLLSGFFGGLSGHQGALRSAFLLKAGLDKTAFVATGVVTAVIVDVVRLGTYGVSAAGGSAGSLAVAAAGPVATATLAAALGAVLGTRLLGKVTLRTVQLLVAAGMAAVGAGLALGWI
jgi:hypothetical protein